MATSPTSPVTITDKNGVVTTRHKKTVATSASSRSIPAPQMPSALSDEQVNELLVRFKTRKGSASSAKLEKAIRTLSKDNYAKMNELLSAPVLCENERDSTRTYLGIEMLTKPSSIGFKRMDIGWKLDAALTLAQGSNLNTAHFLIFAHTIAKDSRYTEIVNDLPSATEQDRQRFCDIASAVTKIAAHHDSKITHKMPIDERTPFIIGVARANGEKYLKFKDQRLVDSLMDHPNKADMIVNMYIERDSIDALDEVLSAPASLSEGAL